jgi:hypothetical protein
VVDEKRMCDDQYRISSGSVPGDVEGVAERHGARLEGLPRRQQVHVLASLVDEPLRRRTMVMMMIMVVVVVVVMMTP